MNTYKSKKKNRNKKCAAVKEFDASVLKKSLGETDFVVFDLETTGGNPEKNRITEIFAIYFTGGKLGATFHSLVDPEIPIPPIVRRITGLNNRMLKGSPKIEQVMPLFLEFIGNRVLVSHNILSDLKFVEYYSNKVCNHSIENIFLCTHLLAIKLISESLNKSLSGLASFLNLTTQSCHRATEDAYCTLELFKELCSRLEQSNIYSLEEAIRFQGDLSSFIRMGWKVDPSLVDEVPSATGVLSFYNELDEKIFVISSFDMKRTINDLKKFEIISKSLARIILQSNRISFTRFSHIFSAMMFENEEVRTHSIKYHPSKWHGRFVSAFIFKETDESIEIFIGQMEKNVVHSFGLINDRKYAHYVVKRIADLLDLTCARGRLLVPKTKANLLLSLFKKKLKRYFLIFMLNNFSFRTIFNSKNREVFLASLAQIHALMRFGSLKVSDLFIDTTGFICLKKKSSAVIYPVLNLTCLAPLYIKEDISIWFTSQEGLQLISKLKREKKFSLNLTSLEQVQNANLILWYIHYQAKKGLETEKFISILTL